MLSISATFTCEPLARPLRFWFDKLGWTDRVRFTTYNQLLQQLADPSSVLLSDSNRASAILVRHEDWARFEGGSNGAALTSAHREVLRARTRELIDAVAAAAHQSSFPFILVLCPPSARVAASPDDAALVHALDDEVTKAFADTARVTLIRGSDLIARYACTEIDDAHGDQIGHVPYSAEFFAVLAAAISRALFSLRSPGYQAFVVDGPPITPALQRAVVSLHDRGAMLALRSAQPERSAWAALDATGALLRRDHVAASRFGADGAADDVAALAAELAVDLAACAFVSDDAAACTAVRARHPDVLTVQLPAAELATYLDHVWAFDRVLPGEIAAGARRVSSHVIGALAELSTNARIVAAIAGDALAKLEGQFQGPTELAIARLAASLGITELSRDADFFSVGMDSLLTLQLFAQIRTTLGVRLPAEALFSRELTIASLARQVDALGSSTSAVKEVLGVPFETGGPSELTPVDPRAGWAHGMFMMYKWGFQQKVYLGFEILGPLQQPILVEALRDLARTHDALRGYYAVAIEGQPIQIGFADPETMPIALNVEDAPERTIDAAYDRVVQEELGSPVDIEKAPAWRARLLRLTDDHHILFMTFEHAFQDGLTTNTLLLANLAKHYTARVRGIAERVEPTAVSFADYLRWMYRLATNPQTPEALAVIEFWKQRLAGIPTRLPLPTDRPRTQEPAATAGMVTAIVDSQTLDGVKQLAQDSRVSLYAVLVAAVHALYGRYAKTDDVVTGGIILHRPHPDAWGTMGNFFNAVPIRANLAGEPTARELLQRTHERVREAFEYGVLPTGLFLPAVSPPNIPHPPVFQSVVNLVPGIEELYYEFGDARIRRVPKETARPTKMPHDFALFFVEVSHTLELRIGFRTDNFDTSTVEHFAASIFRLLRDFCDKPDAPLSSFEIEPLVKS